MLIGICHNGYQGGDTGRHTLACIPITFHLYGESQETNLFYEIGLFYGLD